MSLSTVHRGDSHKPVSRIVAGRLLCGANQIPKYSLMRHGMPAQAARQIIMDDLQLDGRPAQNLASFVTTWMEDEAKDILVQTCATNIADQEEYPASQDIQERCVNMIANLFNGSGGQKLPLEGDDGIEDEEVESQRTQLKQVDKDLKKNEDVEKSENPNEGNKGIRHEYPDEGRGSEPSSQPSQSNTTMTPKDSIGTSTAGSSEAVILGVLAMKWRWRQWRARKAQAEEKNTKSKEDASSSKTGEEPTGTENKAVLKGEGWATSSVMHGRSYGPGSDEPPCNLIINAASHVSVLKACKYLDIQPRVIPLGSGRYTMDSELVEKAMDDNTIGVVCVLGTTLTGAFDPIEDIHKRIVAYNEAHGTDISIHVDAASGGFTVPFTHPDLLWDFRLPQVRSINVSGHKFGLVYVGLGWIVFRQRSDLPEDIIFNVNYLGAKEETYGLNFSRPVSPIMLQYFQFLRLGRTGYEQIMKCCMDNALHLANALNAMGIFEIVSENLSTGKTLPLVVARLKPDKQLRRLLGFNEQDLVHELRTRGWIIPAYTLPKECEDIMVMRILLRESVSAELVNILIDDFKHKAVELMHRHVEQIARIHELSNDVQSSQLESSSSSSPSRSPSSWVDPDAAARRSLEHKILHSVFAEQSHHGMITRKKERQVHQGDKPESHHHSRKEQWRKEGEGDHAEHHHHHHHHHHHEKSLSPSAGEPRSHSISKGHFKAVIC